LKRRGFVRRGESENDRGPSLLKNVSAHRFRGSRRGKEGGRRLWGGGKKHCFNASTWAGQPEKRPFFKRKAEAGRDSVVEGKDCLPDFPQSVSATRRLHQPTQNSLLSEECKRGRLARKALTSSRDDLAPPFMKQDTFSS